MSRSLDQIKAKTDRLSSGFAALRDVFLTYQVGRFIGEQFKYAASLGETAQQLGITSRQLQVYSALAGQAGVEQADLETAITKLTSSLGKAALGAQAPAKAFDALGISLRKSNGDIKTAGDALPEIADKLSRVTDPAQRAAAEVALFGRSGQKLDNILTGGSKGIEDYAKQLEETGQILDDKLIQQADTAADRVEELNRQLKVSVAKTVAENATSILALANALATLTGRALQFISNYPRLTAALAGAAAGARLGGLPGALVGGGLGFAGTTFYQQNSSMDVGTRAHQLGLVTEQVNRMVARGVGKSNPSALRQQLNELHRQEGLLAQARAANATPNLPALPPALPGEDLPNFMAGGGGGGSKKTPKAPKDHSADYFLAFQSDLARLDDQLLDAKQRNIADINMIADIDRQKLTVERGQFEKTIAADVAEGKLTKVQADQLLARDAQVRAEQSLTISTEQLAENSKQLLDVQMAANDNERDILQAQESLAVTSADRRIIALKLLDIDKEEERLRLQNIIDLAKIGKATAAEAQAAEARLGKIDAIYAPRTEAIKQQTESPLDRYVRENDPARHREKVEELTIQQLDAVGDGITDAITSRLGIKDPFLASLLRLFIQENLLNPIAEALQRARQSSGGGGGGTGWLGTALKIGASIAGGGGGGFDFSGVSADLSPSTMLDFQFANGTTGAPGGLSIVGERGPELLNLPTGAQVIPNHRMRGMAFDGGAGNDNVRPIETHFHFAGNMSERERRETSGQAMRELRREMGRSTRMGG